jgi:nucleoside-diphosphate-sugar epimerase
LGLARPHNKAMRIFVAGATGVIGRRLIPLLLRDGHVVTGTTRSSARAASIAQMGASPVVVDVFDRPALTAAVREAAPEVVIHQLTDLPDQLDSGALAAALPRNARIRIEGTRNLVDASVSAGTTRFVVQSIAFVYAPGPEPHGEEDPLAPPEGEWKDTINGVLALEQAVTHTNGIAGLVLRYGQLYGPGTWTETPPASMPLHVDAAADAARLAATRGAPGIYNIAEADGSLAIDKAQRELGFNPSFRMTQD